MINNFIFKITDIHNEEIRVAFNSINTYKQVGAFIELRTTAETIQFPGDVKIFDETLDKLMNFYRKN